MRDELRMLTLDALRAEGAAERGVPGADEVARFARQQVDEYRRAHPAARASRRSGGRRRNPRWK